MNPNTNKMVSSLPNDPIIKQPHPVNQITPLSKYLALALFVILPFVGAYVGYQLAPEKVVIMPISVTKEEVPVSQGKIQSLRYINSGDWNEYVTDEKNFTKINVIDSVLFNTDSEDFLSVGQSPYFVQLLSSTTDYNIFCTPSFGKGGTCNGLIKYSLTTKKLERLNTSDLYNPFYTNGLLASDGRSVFIVSEDGTEVGQISFDTDTYLSLQKYDITQSLRFKICGEMSCESEIKMTDENTIQVKEYEFSSCEDNGCSNQKEIGTKYVNISI